MLKGLKFILIFGLFALLGGCSSSCGSATEGNTNTQTNVIVPERSDTQPMGSNANTNMVNGLKNANMNNPTLDNSNVKVIDTTNVNTAPPKKQLPDRSELSTKSVGAKFVETRKFLEHPQLDKLERIIDGKDIIFKIYLKNGKTFNLAQEKLKDYKTASAYDILKAVGVDPMKTDKPGGKTKEDLIKEGSVVPKLN